MVKKNYIKKDYNNLATIIGFWTIQGMFIYAKLFINNISWWTALIPLLLVLGVSFLIALTNVMRLR